MNFVKTIKKKKNLLMHIRENIDFPWQKPQNCQFQDEFQRLYYPPTFQQFSNPPFLFLGFYCILSEKHRQSGITTKYGILYAVESVSCI